MEMCWCESPGPVTGRGAVFADGGPASSAAVSEDCWLCCAALEEGASAAYRPAQHGKALNADVKLWLLTLPPAHGVVHNVGGKRP